jgi:hypothetical protein
MYLGTDPGVQLGSAEVPSVMDVIGRNETTARISLQGFLVAMDTLRGLSAVKQRLKIIGARFRLVYLNSSEFVFSFHIVHTR